MNNEFKNPWENTEDNKKDNINTNNNDNNNIDNNFNKINNFYNNFYKNNSQNNNNTNYFFSKIEKKHIIYLIFILLFLWLSNGIYKIDTNQQGIVLYFGKFYKITNPGLNYMIPTPIGRLYKVPVTNINKEEFGFRTLSKNNINMNNESLMLTGDENIVDIDFEVQWRIKNAKHYLFNLSNPRNTIRMATESAMREIIGKRKIDDALASKKSAIEEEVFNLSQIILDNYNSGIEILLVQLLRVDPPAEVIAAFRDVQTAKADKERKINEAETYKNDVIPKARGEAESIVKEAEGYKESVISNAEGEVANFLKVYKEYQKNPTLTKKRIYLETMNEVMKDVDKIIIDNNISKNVLQHLLLNNKE